MGIHNGGTCFAWVAIAWAASLPAYAQTAARELIVRYRDHAPAISTGASAVYRYGGLFRNLARLTFDSSAQAQVARRELASLPSVEYVEPNSPLSPDLAEVEAASSFPCFFPGIAFPFNCTSAPPDPIPSDNRRPAMQIFPWAPQEPVFERLPKGLYGLQKIQVQSLWARKREGRPVTVAVLDSGVDYNHRDLAPHLWRNPSTAAGTASTVGYDFIHGDALPYDDLGHGTHVAGVIGAVSSDARIMALKFISNQNKGTVADAILALDYALLHGARVIHSSWAYPSEEEPQALRDAILLADRWGALFVTAAGNDQMEMGDLPRRSYPGALGLPNMITVAASDENDALWGSSNTGARYVHLAAPGVGIYSTLPRGEYGLKDGTSMAAPHVTGAVALLWALHPEWTHLQVKQAILEGVDLLPSMQGKVASGGRLNVQKAEERGANPWRARSPYSPL